MIKKIEKKLREERKRDKKRREERTRGEIRKERRKRKRRTPLQREKNGQRGLGSVVEISDPIQKGDRKGSG